MDAWILELHFEYICSERKTNKYIRFSANGRKKGRKEDFWKPSYAPGFLHILSYFLLQQPSEVEIITLMEIEDPTTSKH